MQKKKILPTYLPYFFRTFKALDNTELIHLGTNAIFYCSRPAIHVHSRGWEKLY